MKLKETEQGRHCRNQILQSEEMSNQFKNNIKNTKNISTNNSTIRNTPKKKSSIVSKFLNFLFYPIMIGFIGGLFLMYGPYNGFRDWYITTAMTTMSHQYLATWFYSDKTINEVLDKNKIIEIDAITDPTLVTTTASTGKVTYANEYEKAILEKDPANPDYKIIEIEEDKFSGYIAAVYDASKIQTLVTSRLNVSGQFVTTMAKNKNAVLAINGGFFVDLKEDRTGGTPLGITISNGKILTSGSSTTQSNLVGFSEDNKLVIGKMTLSEAKKMKIRDAVTSEPFLIINGEASTVVGNGGWGTAPRTAIGQRQDGIVLFLVIDGRRVGKPGATMEDVIEIMQRYGAYNASALDGGTSSVMVENYEIINDPIDSDGVHKTRPVATAFGLILDERKNDD